MDIALRQALQRSGPLARLPGVLARHGATMEGVLSGLSGVPEALLADTFLPIRVIAEILDRASAAIGQPVGILLAEHQNHESLGPVGQLMACSATLGAAIEAFVSFQITNSTAGAAYLHRIGGEYVFGFGLYGPELGSGHIYDMSATVGCNMVRDLTGGAVAPLEVYLSRSAPADPAPYLRMARCPVRFSESQTCIILPARSMDFRLATADAAAHAALLVRLQRQLAPGRIGMGERVRHALRPLLLSGRATLPEVAASLALHPRTLERRLAEEHAVFEHLKDEVRLSTSRELLALTGLSISEISAALGYATASAFVRAFRRWTGQPPSKWRREFQQRAAGG